MSSIPLPGWNVAVFAMQPFRLREWFRVERRAIAIRTGIRQTHRREAIVTSRG